MTEQQVLEEAIASLRKHQSVLGQTVVETAVSALQDQILSIGTTPLIQQFETVTILQADISGFTAMSARMDAEQVSDVINALWQRLDNVVLSWGGQIEQHTGDGLIALFGVPLAQEDDAHRAILAALDMQLELSLFNEATSAPTDTSPLGHSLARTDFRMRIGVHSGPLMWGRVGQSLGETAVGDTVQIVGQLEKMCPVDGVLISYDVYRQVFGLFDVEPGTSLSLPGREDELPVYVVEREKSRAFQTMTLAEHGIKSGFVGRMAELERLEFALQETLDNGVMQVVTVTGEAGIGKTRLFDEFERWLEMMPVRGCLMRSQSMYSEEPTPFGALRRLFMDYFEIHKRSTLPVVLERFVRGVGHVGRTHKISAQEQAHVMGQFLGFDFSNSPYVRDLQDEPERLKKYGLQDLTRFFTDLSAQLMPIVILLENVQWADSESLDAIDYLLETCYDLPILVICLARPELMEKRPLWDTDDDPLSAYVRLSMQPLSAIESRHMVADILPKVRHIPFKLSDLIIYNAQGNPLYLEQLVHLLYDADIIQKQELEDNVNLGKLETFDAPNSLSDMFAARVAILPYEEKKVIEAATVSGLVFWDEPILEILSPEIEFGSEGLQMAFTSLEQKGFIFRQRSSIIAGTSEFAFAHDMLLDVIYEQIVRPVRKIYHARLADWLVGRMKTQDLFFYAPMIAAHYRKAGQMEAANQWSGRR